MTLYIGRKRDVPFAAEVDDLGNGAGRVTCLECRGTGVWDFMEPEEPACACVECKGTGRILVSVP